MAQSSEWSVALLFLLQHIILFCAASFVVLIFVALSKFSISFQTAQNNMLLKSYIIRTQSLNNIQY